MNTFISLLCGIVGCLCVVFGAQNICMALLSKGWPATPGVVSQSSIESQASGDGSTIHAKVAYHYLVTGVEHSSTRVSFGEYGSTSDNHAKAVISKYPVGKAVSVFYQPNNPSSAVLEPGLTGNPWLLLIVGAGFFIGSWRFRRKA